MRAVGRLHWSSSVTGSKGRSSSEVLKRRNVLLLTFGAPTLPMRVGRYDARHHGGGGGARETGARSRSVAGAEAPLRRRGTTNSARLSLPRSGASRRIPKPQDVEVIQAVEKDPLGAAIWSQLSVVGWRLYAKGGVALLLQVYGPMEGQHHPGSCTRSAARGRASASLEKISGAYGLAQSFCRAGTGPASHCSSCPSIMKF